MATRNKSVGECIKQFDRAVSNTLVECADDLCVSVKAELKADGFDSCDMDAAREWAKEHCKDMKSAGPRTTEFKDFIFSAANYNFRPALNEAKKAFYPITRVQVFAFAKQFHLADGNTKKAIAAVKNQKGGKGSSATLGMGIGIIKRVKKAEGVSQKNLIEFRKELAALCKKYSIKY